MNISYIYIYICAKDAAHHTKYLNYFTVPKWPIELKLVTPQKHSKTAFELNKNPAVWQAWWRQCEISTSLAASSAFNCLTDMRVTWRNTRRDHLEQRTVISSETVPKMAASFVGFGPRALCKQSIYISICLPICLSTFLLHIPIHLPSYLPIRMRSHGPGCTSGWPCKWWKASWSFWSSITMYRSRIGASVVGAWTLHLHGIYSNWKHVGIMILVLPGMRRFQPPSKKALPYWIVLAARWSYNPYSVSQNLCSWMVSASCIERHVATKHEQQGETQMNTAGGVGGGIGSIVVLTSAVLHGTCR